MLIKDLDCLENILESIEKIELYSAQLKSADNLLKDSKSFDAILMNFIIVGEMVAKLSEEFKSEYTEIEWWKIKGFRNIVAHNYFGIDAEEVWQIIQNKLPQLKSFIQKSLKKTEYGNH
ncbi:MAG: DUF86 domain-containing protein [Prolixibacteraceae bacterium]|nr:DUF86 domain-containing protein [Prolixibacteraceae bacterium]MBT6766650.1 DUF86 domain-containing protein [Prolixibacteraceae bacterium]MBT6997563.1 DUF86 domain-containing protein [Prolixibacteraceae bacterium]MBT7394543.1 DUF86 domain-containing protein [Prolixibacteraceae bacterium]